MTTEETIPDVTGFSIDPSTWVEPKETFPGIVLTSEYRWCADKYLDEVTLRIANQSQLTVDKVLELLKTANPTGVAKIPQWDLRVKRLDTILQLPDGSQADAVRYGGFDLVKWSNRDNTFVPINPNYGKEAFISGGWKKVAGHTEPPTILVGRMFTFDYFPSKRFGGAMPAKRVLVPTAVLPPDYKFAGEIAIIVVPDRGDAVAADTTEAVAPTSGASYDELIDKLVATVLPGKNAKQAAKLLAALPQELWVPEIQSGLATGDLITKLAAQQRIVIADDGTISLP